MRRVLALLILLGVVNSVRSEPHRPRARDAGVVIGRHPTGPLNAITDVPGVAVGHVTLIEGSGALVVGKGPVRTGVTAVVPHPGDIYAEPVYAAAQVINGYGDMTGLSWIQESGRLESPIMLTNSISIGAVYEGVLDYALKHDHDPMPVVAECYDGGLNDIKGRHVTRAHAVQAIRSAKTGKMAEGSVGGGTGMRSYGYKAGIGTSSRQVELSSDGYAFTVGVLVNANFGRRANLTIAGVPIGARLPDASDPPKRDGSIIIVIATDAPLLPIQLRNLCGRAAFGIARTGSSSRTSSGDFAIAFSTAKRHKQDDSVIDRSEHVRHGELTPLYEAVSEATEEAILNAMFKADTMVGQGDSVMPGLPVDRVKSILKEHGRLAE